MIMDANGYVMLTDLGISKQLDDINIPCEATSGTGGYMAPELYVAPHEHGVASEWFSAGICLYEFVAGFGPYESGSGDMKTATSHSTMDTSTRTSASLATSPFKRLGIKTQQHCSKQCNNFIAALLHIEPKQRLGGTSVLLTPIKKHPWWRKSPRFDWAACEAQTMKAPFRPNTKHANVETGKYDARDMFESVPAASTISAEEDSIFEDYFFISASNKALATT
jgi:serine/threonine protein kinase